MRLLERDASEILLTENFPDDKIPPYAILSHTWGSDEVLLKDLADGKGKTKLGYEKLQFCGEQARRDGLRYFWVDTCCIDKNSSAELQETISCMFRFYRDAVKCYVYLADVSRISSSTDDDDDDDDEKPLLSRWKPAFRKSRWFTRGWTLQELIAPATVEFFSKEGVYLGSKWSLEESIHEITGIPRNVLQGSPVFESSVEQRLEWIQNRETTRKEDKAYSLLGLFDVHMPLLYGEGREKAFKRLLDEIEKGSKGKEAERDANEKFTMGFKLPGITPVDRFVARGEELAKLHDALSKGTDRRTVVVHGLGGMGKTQLCVEYAKRHQDDYSAVFWLNARDKASLKQAFAQVAERILHELPPVAYIKNAIDSHDLDQAVQAVKRWLDGAKNNRWLIIYDNYDNPMFIGDEVNIDGDSVVDGYDIRMFLPDVYHGAVLITTRSSRIQFGQRVPLKKLQDIKDSLEILSHTSGRQDLHKDDAAVELAKNLDGLPLALSTAGAYLCNMTTSCAEYIQMYNTSWLRLQQTTPSLDSYNRTLYSTWDVSYTQVKSENATSAMLLQLWAYFDHEDLWFGLLEKCQSIGPLWFQKMTQDIIEFNKATRVLCDYGLAEADTSSKEYGTESRGYSIHSCVHAWTIHVLDEVKNDTSAWLAIRCICSKLPENTEREYWVMQRRLLRHGAYCLTIILNGIPVPEGDEWTLQKLGDLFVDQGRLAEAEAMYDRALQSKEKALGPDHTSTLDTVNSLGMLYRLRGRFDEAEAMYDRALQGKEKALGADHMSTLKTVNSLGILYSLQGRINEAEAMYDRALRGKEKALGTEHTSTLTTVNNLGIFYYDQGRLNEAEAMYNRALQGYEKALGPNHTSTLTAVNNLGMLCRRQGRLSEAEAMYDRALQGYEKALGPDHAVTLAAVNSLGTLYNKQGLFDKAEAMYDRALRGHQNTLTEKDVNISILAVDNVEDFAKFYIQQGKITQASALYMQYQESFKAVFGVEHARYKGLTKALESLGENSGT